MKELHDRINRVIHTEAFEAALETEGVDLFEFQADWSSYHSFNELPAKYRKAIIAGERELNASGEVVAIG